MNSKSTQTVRVVLETKYKGNTISKDWVLLTYKRAKELVLSQNQQRELEKRFWDIEKRDLIGEYPLKKGKVAAVTNDDFVESLSHTSLRTQALFDLPCAICTDEEQLKGGPIHMHHLRHVRKSSIARLSKTNLRFKEALAIYNRKQIPLCEFHHRQVVHAGNYVGAKLADMVPETRILERLEAKQVYDNRILYSESFINKGQPQHGKTLRQKGFTEKGNKPNRDLDVPYTPDFAALKELLERKQTGVPAPEQDS